MVFLEVLGAATLLTIFGVGAWHVWKHFFKGEERGRKSGKHE